MKPRHVIASVGSTFGIVLLIGAAALSWRNDQWKEMFRQDKIDNIADANDRGLVEAKLNWRAGTSLIVAVAADVTFIDSPETTVVARGPAWLVRRLEMDGDTLRQKGRMHDFRGEKLFVTISAPRVHAFTVNSAATLTIKDTSEAAMAIEVNGAGDVQIQNVKSETLTIRSGGASNVTAAGEATVITLNVSGAGNVDVSAVNARRADIHVIGFGHVRAAPRGVANILIEGAGSVALQTRPPRLDSQIAGAGSVRVVDEDLRPRDTVQVR